MRVGGSSNRRGHRIPQPPTTIILDIQVTNIPHGAYRVGLDVDDCEENLKDQMSSCQFEIEME